MVTIASGSDGIVVINGISIEQYIAYVKARPGLRLRKILDALMDDGYRVEFIPFKELEMSAPDTPDDKPYAPGPDSLETMPAEGHAEPGDSTVAKANPNIEMLGNSYQNYLEITDDPLSNRSILQAMIDKLRGPDGRAPSREVALAITKLQEARFWLGEAEFAWTDNQFRAEAADKSA